MKTRSSSFISEWFENSPEKQIALDRRNDVCVSTIFRGFDHRRWGSQEQEPLLFETTIVGGLYDEFQFLYATYDEAEKGHARACDQAGVLNILDAEIITV